MTAILPGFRRNAIADPFAAAVPGLCRTRPGRRAPQGAGTPIRLEQRIDATRTRLQAIQIGADVRAGQVQHLEPKPLDTPRSPPIRGRLPMRPTGLRDPAHGRRERRVLKLEINAKPRTEVRVPIGDHVDALRRRAIASTVCQPMCATCLCSLSVQSKKRLQFKRPMIGQSGPESGRTSDGREPGCLVWPSLAAPGARAILAACPKPTAQPPVEGRQGIARRTRRSWTA